MEKIVYVDRIIEKSVEMVVIKEVIVEKPVEIVKMVT